MAQRPPSRGKGGGGGFYRLCRMMHAYFSAFAFLILMFFSITGLLLDHPEWMQARGKEAESKLTLPATVMAEAKSMKDPAPFLAAQTASRTPLIGCSEKTCFSVHDVIGTIKIHSHARKSGRAGL